MPSLVIKDGKVVEMDDNGKPVAATRTNRPAGTPRKAPPAAESGGFGSTLKRIGERGLVSSALDLVSTDAGDWANAMGRRFDNGITLGLNDRLGAVGRASTEGYSKGLETERAKSTAARDKTGFAGDALEFASGMAVPGIGVGGKAAAKVYRAVRGAGAGSKAARVASYAIPAAGAGASTGAITGALQSEDYTKPGQVAKDALSGGGVGLAAGAGLGLVAPFASRVGRRVGQQLRGRAGARERVAEARTDAEGEVLGMLRDQRLTPKAADETMDAMRATGADPVLADVTDATGQRVKTLMDTPSVPRGYARQSLTERANDRGGRLREKIGEITGDGAALDARKEAAGIRKGRLDKGKEQYAVGGALDEPIQVSDELHDIINGRHATTHVGEDDGVSYLPNQTMSRAARKAIDAINANLDLPGAVRRVPNPKFTGDPASNELPETVVPTMRVMDEMLRDMRAQVSKLYNAGEPGAATAVKSQMNALRDQLKEANPDYAEILQYQAQELAREDAYKLVKPLTGKLFSNPREVNAALDDIKDPDLLAEARKGLLSHVIDLTAANGDMVGKLGMSLNRAKRQPEKTQMWERILGGPDKLDALKQFLQAEGKSLRTDQMAFGGSSTSRNQLDANAAGDAMGLENLLAAGRAGVNAMAGQPAGAAANLGMIARSVGKAKQVAEDAPSKARQLRTLLNRQERGGVTRMEARNLKAQEAATKRRERTGRRFGRAGGLIGSSVTASGNTED